MTTTVTKKLLLFFPKCECEKPIIYHLVKDYNLVVNVFRAKVTPEEEGVFYPRGLYPDDDTLFAQIETLLDKVEDYGFDGDLQLLLGYHLLGVGETAYARTPLEQAGRDIENAGAAKVLLELLEKIETTGAEGAGQSPQIRNPLIDFLQ